MGDFASSQLETNDDNNDGDNQSQLCQGQP